MFVAQNVVGEVDKWMERFDCLVVGPGLGRDPFLLVSARRFHMEEHYLDHCARQFTDHNVSFSMVPVLRCFCHGHANISWATEGNLNISPINQTVLGYIAASALSRKAASLAFDNSKRSTLTSGIIKCLGRSLEDICPAC